MPIVAVTGAFGALGKAVCAAFWQADFAVARIDYGGKGAEANPSGIDLPGVDLADRGACGAAFAEISRCFGHIDILVNIAGGFSWSLFGTESASNWDNMWRTNTLTAVLATASALPLISKSCSGAIVNVGAAAALQAGPGMAAYAATKSAIHRLTEALAAEWHGRGIRVNAVLPSIIDTPANREAMPDSDFRKWVQPEAVADAILFLSSDRARGITGALLPVTNGSSR